jgi:hypothetical protein
VLGGQRLIDAPADHSFDGPHTAYLTCRDVAGNSTSLTRPFVVDTTAPESRLLPDDGAWHRWKEFRVTASDADGVAVTHVLIDGTPVAGDTPDGVHTITYWSEDDAAPANVEPVHTATIRVDGTPPAIVIAQNRRLLRRGQTLALRTHVFDAMSPQVHVVTTLYRGARLVRRLGLGWVALASVSNRLRLPRGAYTWHVWAEDRAGNEATAKAAFRSR